MANCKTHSSLTSGWQTYGDELFILLVCSQKDPQNIYTQVYLDAKFLAINNSDKVISNLPYNSFIISYHSEIPTDKRRVIDKTFYRIISLSQKKPLSLIVRNNF